MAGGRRRRPGVGGDGEHAAEAAPARERRDESRDAGPAEAAAVQEVRRRRRCRCLHGGQERGTAGGEDEYSPDGDSELEWWTGITFLACRGALFASRWVVVVVVVGAGAATRAGGRAALVVAVASRLAPTANAWTAGRPVEQVCLYHSPER